MSTESEPPRAGRLDVGCAMWANRDWVGRWFPADTPPGRELSTYASWCTAVEGNTTFYAPPNPTAVAKWAEQAPEGFAFCFKLPRTITHDRRLRNCADELASFLRLLEPLDGRLGPTQIQLPASFGPADLAVLLAFCDALPKNHQWAVEVRHLDFFAGGTHEAALDEQLSARGINRVILDSRVLFNRPPETPDEIEGWERKPRVPVRPVDTGEQPIVRLIGERDPEVSLDGWSRWYPKLAEWVDRGRAPIVFTHTPNNADAPMLARALWERVDQLAESILEPLPEPVQAIESPSLF